MSRNRGGTRIAITWKMVEEVGFRINPPEKQMKARKWIGRMAYYFRPILTLKMVTLS